MGIKSSKPRLMGTPSRRDSSAISSTDKSERDELEQIDELEESGPLRVALLCQAITESNKQNEIEELLSELRKLCGEMTANLYKLTELQ